MGCDKGLNWFVMSVTAGRSNTRSLPTCGQCSCEQLPGNSARVTRVLGDGSEFRDSTYADRGVGVRVNQLASATVFRQFGTAALTAWPGGSYAEGHGEQDSCISREVNRCLREWEMGLNSVRPRLADNAKPRRVESTTLAGG